MASVGGDTLAVVAGQVQPEQLVDVASRLRGLGSRLKGLESGSQDENRSSAGMIGLLSRTAHAIEDLSAAGPAHRRAKRAWAINMITDLMATAVRDPVNTDLHDGTLSAEFNAVVSDAGDILGDALKLVIKS